MDSITYSSDTTTCGNRGTSCSSTDVARIEATRLKISDGEFGEWFIREESDTFLKADVETITLVVLYFASDIFFLPYGPH